MTWLGLLVEHARGDVDVLGVVEQIDDRALGGLAIFDGRDLVQILDDRGVLPHGVVDAAVDDGRDVGVLRRRRFRLLCYGGRAKHQASGDREVGKRRATGNGRGK